MKRGVIIIYLLTVFTTCFSQHVQYPYPVNYFNINIENQDVKMAYMDVKPAKPNGETVMLLHGKNFNGFYWKDVIPFLTEAGYRVIVPDQVGWGKSSKPNMHYSFFMLANNNARLLDSLGIKKVNVIAHSMGGMLATRFVLMFPQKVDKLIYENPIGLEDYSQFVPYQTLETLYQKESKASYESIKKYQQTYYPVWKDEYEPYVKAQAEQLNDPNFSQIAFVNALTYQMIYEQPVVHSFDSVRVPTLLIIGQADRTVVGKDQLNEQQKKVYGNYRLLGRRTREHIKNSKLVELTGVGHIPHIQAFPLFKQNVLQFLQGRGK
jgi:pimeloyl-ACP methyl ester carboxylesterase